MTRRIPLGKRRSARWLIGLLAATGGALAGCDDSQESTSGATLDDGALHGTLVVLATDGPGAGFGMRYFLRQDDATLTRLSFEPGQAPKSATGTRVKVRGIPQSGVLRVQQLELETRGASGLGTATEALTSPTKNLSRTAAVVRVSLNGGDINQTESFFQSYFFSTTNAGPVMGFGSTDHSVVQYYDETSYGAYALSGAVENATYAGSICTDYGDALAATLRSSVGSYDSYVWYFGVPQYDGNNNLCGYGWGTEGTADYPQGDVWMNGDLWPTAIPHEMGHNLGLMHASTLDCGSVTLNDSLSSCTTGEYDNPYTIMGNSSVQHLNGIEKWYLGWIGGCNGVRVKSSGTFTLVPIEDPSNGVQVLQIPMPVTTRTYSTEQSGNEGTLYARYYYLELRASTGLDTGITPQVLVHVSDDIADSDEVSQRTLILDMKPSTNEFDGMAQGDSFTDPASGVTFSVSALSSSQATVNVTLSSSSGSSLCMDGSTWSGSGGSSSGGSSSGGSTSTGTSGSGGTSADGTSTGNGTSIIGGMTGLAATTSQGGATASLGGAAVTGLPGTTSPGTGVPTSSLDDGTNGGGCGCRVAVSPSRNTTTPLLLAGALLAILGRRRRVSLGKVR